MESISHLYHSEVEARLLLITVRRWSFLISDRGLAILLGGGGGHFQIRECYTRVILIIITMMPLIGKCFDLIFI